MSRIKYMDADIKSKTINGVRYYNPDYDPNCKSTLDLYDEVLIDALCLFGAFFSENGFSGIIAFLGKLSLYTFYIVVFNILASVVIFVGYVIVQHLVLPFC